MAADADTRVDHQRLGVARRAQRDCTTAVRCPSALVVDGGAGCSSACAKVGGDQYCCRVQFASRQECNPANWPIDYAAVFKKAEPYAYSYSDDDATSTFTCSGECDYRITFGLSP